MTIIDQVTKLERLMSIDPDPMKRYRYRRLLKQLIAQVEILSR